MVEEIKALAEVLSGLGEYGFWAFVIWIIKDLLGDLVGLIVFGVVLVKVARAIMAGLLELKES